VRLERWQDAREQLLLNGPYATSFPWDRVSDDPLGHFLGVRDDIRAASGQPPWHPPGERGGRVRSGDH
jgi:hypothetical protein